MARAPFGFAPWPVLPAAPDDEATPVGLAPGQMPVDPRRDGSVQPTAAGRDLSRAVGVAAGSMAQGLLDAAKLPADVYAGRVDPMSDEGIQRANDLAGFAMTGGIAAPARAAGEAALGSGPIRAYHGSPHDFDRFSVAHIGAGEGNQAFGHGLYFAGNEKVAEAYRDASRGLIAPRVTLDGKPYDWQAAMRGGADDLGDEFAALLSGQAPAKAIDPHAAAGEMMGMAGADPAVAMDALRFRASGADPAGARAYQDAIDLIRSGRVQGHVPPPRMYEVAIDADPARFLDYGAPLASQPRVRDALGGLGPVGDRPGLTAGEALSSVQRSVDPATVAASLRDAGVPGVRYDDALSRGLGNGTVRSQNYVTFGDDIVSILRKYGAAGAVGAGGTAAALTPGDSQAAPSPSGSPSPMAFSFAPQPGPDFDAAFARRRGEDGGAMSLADQFSLARGLQGLAGRMPAAGAPAAAPDPQEPQQGEPPAVAPFSFAGLAPRASAASPPGMGFGPGSPGAGLPLPEEPTATGTVARPARPAPAPTTPAPASVAATAPQAPAATSAAPGQPLDIKPPVQPAAAGSGPDFMTAWRTLGESGIGDQALAFASGLLSAPGAAGFARGFAGMQAAGAQTAAQDLAKAKAAVERQKLGQVQAGYNATVEGLVKKGVAREDVMTAVAAAQAGQGQALQNLLNNAYRKQAETPFGWQQNDAGGVQPLPGGPQDPATIKAQAEAREADKTQTPLTDPTARLRAGIRQDDKRSAWLDANGKVTYESGQPNTQVTVNNAVNPILKGLGDQFVEGAASARSAADQVRSITNAREQLDRDGGLITGFRANDRLALQKVGALLGVTDPNAIQNTESLRAALKPMVLESIKALGTNPSNNDLTFANGFSGGDINLDEGSIRRIMDLNERAARAKIERHNALADKMLTTQPDLGAVGPMLRIDMPAAYAPPAPAQSAPAAAPVQAAPTAPARPRRVFDPASGSFR